MYKNKIFFFGFLLFFSFALKSNAEEKITVSTYYPSPSGVYNTLRLMPRATPPASGEPGELCYLDGTGPGYSAEGVYVYVQSTAEWKSALGSGDLENKLPLVKAIHTGEDCINAGGQIVDTETSFKQCRFNAPACPAGWKQYEFWSACASNTCGNYKGILLKTPEKPWQNKYFENDFRSFSCNSPNCQSLAYERPVNHMRCCDGQIIQIGCY